MVGMAEVRLGRSLVFDIGSNLTYVLVALISAIPSIIAAYYARRASGAASATNQLVNGVSHELTAAKVAEATATGHAAGVASERDRIGP
jgi:hypothetical protein